MIKLSYIREYVQLAETLNFTKTAEMTYITQPALSRHIAVLEREMGAKLLERTTRTVVLTPAGEAVHEAFRLILSTYSRAQNEAKSFEDVSKGSLIINSPYYWTGDYTEPLLIGFKSEYPECGISIHSCQPIDGLEGLQRGECDIYISMEMMGIEPPVLGRPFAKEELRVFMPSGHHLAEKDCLTTDDFHDQIFIYVKGFEKMKNVLLEHYAQQGVFPAEIVCCEQIDSLGMVLQQKSGLCLLPYGVRRMDRPYIISRSFSEPMYTDMHVYYRQDTTNPMVELFLETVQ